RASWLSSASVCVRALFQKASLARLFPVCVHVVFLMLPLPTQNTFYAFQRRWQCPGKDSVPSAKLNIRRGHEAIHARALRCLLRQSCPLFQCVHIVQSSVETGACSSLGNNRNG